jgi:hypothetical protein
MIEIEALYLEAPCSGSPGIEGYEAIDWIKIRRGRVGG